jgi:hypothetical protein
MIMTYSFAALCFLSPDHALDRPLVCLHPFARSSAGERVRRVLVASLIHRLHRVLRKTCEVLHHESNESKTYRAKLSGELDTLSRVIVVVLGGDKLGRGVAIFNPVNHGSEH